MTVSVEFGRSLRKQTSWKRIEGFQRRAAGARLAERAGAARRSTCESETVRSRAAMSSASRAWRPSSAGCASARCSTTSSSRSGHNTVRGAAGAAVLNAELMYSEGMLD